MIYKCNNVILNPKPKKVKAMSKIDSFKDKRDPYSFFVMFQQKKKCSERNFRILVWRANLIRHSITPNQDDLSYSARTFHFRPANRVSCQTHSFWSENAVQCRRHTGLSSIAMLFTWAMPPSSSSSSSMDTRGNPSNLWIPCKEPQLNIN